MTGTSLPAQLGYHRGVDHVVIGLVPTVVDDDETVEHLEVVRGTMARALGMPCAIHRAVSPGALLFAFGSGAVHLAWSSPTLALTAPEMRDATPICCSIREGVAHYHGVLFVRNAAHIASPLQLRGRRAAWVAGTSAAGFIFPRVALAGHGIDPESLFSEERYLGSYGAVARAVRDDFADVGASFAVFEGGDATRPMLRSGFTQVEGCEDMRVILSTPPIPADLWVASRTLMEALGRPALEGALQALASEAPEAIRRVFGAEAFEPTDERGLADLRRQLDDARQLGVIS
ncbi:MAG: hypothetical protein SangKO_011910 [Sandaracinaceae bacterium]